MCEAGSKSKILAKFLRMMRGLPGNAALDLWSKLRC
jgi:hypothetical protein